MATAPQKPPPAQPSSPLTIHWRIVISVALLIHLTAVIAAPLAVQPASELQGNFAQSLRPYICASYLDHGYRFFAPMPSPGHLVRYKLEMPDGTSHDGVFPDLKTEQPRLFYHRHFMLSEKLAQVFDPEQPRADEPAEVRAEWQRERQVFQTIAESYARYLLKTSGAKRVTLEFVQHELPSPADLENDRPLDNPKSYTVLWTGSYGTETL